VDSGAGIPGFPGRRYSSSRAELIVDGVIHAVGLILVVAGGFILLTELRPDIVPEQYFAAAIYVSSLLTVFSISCAYNLWPISPTKRWLRRLDHAAIFLLIAGTYTPLLLQMTQTELVQWMVAVIWSVAALGAIVKLFLPGRFERLAVGFYVAMGFTGVIVFRSLTDALPATALWLILGGALVYCTGVSFYLWPKLRFHVPTWHAFVVVAASLHLSAIIDTLVLARS
jgi:hemolysin III